MFSDSIAFDRRALPCLTPLLIMRCLFLVSICLVATVLNAMTVHQTNTSNPSSSIKPLTCCSLSQDLIDPKNYISFRESVNYLVIDTCEPNNSEAEQASAICFAVHSIDSGFQQISFKYLALKCRGNTCRTFSYIIKQCSSCSLNYVWFVIWTTFSFYAVATHDHDPIEARIHIESAARPRRDQVRSLFEEWKLASNVRILFHTLKYTIKKKRGLRYLIIYRFKNRVSNELG